MKADTVVIGAGLGGLLAAAVAARAGQSVIVVERMPWPGGRFTTVAQDGYEVTTGALHMVPYGAGGVLARVLTSLGIGYRGISGGPYASFFKDGRETIWQRPFDIYQLLGIRAKAELFKIITLLFLPGTHPSQAFKEWLSSQTDDETIHSIFERFAHFALSIRCDQLPYDEMRRIFMSFRRYGLPSTPVGGCRQVIEDLCSYVSRAGGNVRCMSQATHILVDPQSGRVNGVQIRDRRSNVDICIETQRIVSDIGPAGTWQLFDRPTNSDDAATGDPAAAEGLKLHIVSDKPLMSHGNVMLCLDTQRIAGIVEITRSVPSVAPPGAHLLDTFQILMGPDFATERRLAIEDLRYAFGDDFDRHCHVLRASAFRAAWPVNRAIQGRDTYPRSPLPGLLMVGDAYKPAGHIMVEGVAASVELMAAAIGALPDQPAASAVHGSVTSAA